MNILFLGDVVGQPGCQAVRRFLPGFKREHSVDVVIANGENSAIGNGVLPQSANHLLDSGVDLLTTGNHVYRRREIYPYLEAHPGQIIRPANYPSSAPGVGYTVYDGGRFRLGVINLMGVVFMEALDNPFHTVDQILPKLKDCNAILVDFHAEATGEKRAMGFYLDGRVTAVIGTHTHVQTADEQILPKGTAYLTDAGMVGPEQSVLGVKPEAVLKRHLTHMPSRFETADGPCRIQGILLNVEAKSGKVNKVTRVNLV